MGRSVFETILGAVVLAVAALFLGFAYTNSDLHVVKGYTISANFPMVGASSRSEGVLVTLFLAVLLPLAVLVIGLGVLIGGNVGRVLLIAGCILAGVDLVLVLTGR